MLIPTTVSNEDELKSILALQQLNLINNISHQEMQEQGFVTMHHSFDELKQMHEIAPSVIVKDKDQVVGYALTMFRTCRPVFPPLEPMFAKFDELSWKNKPLNDYEYYAMGQICIDKAYRSQGVFDLLYKTHKEIYQNKFDFIITEVSSRNHRSLRAHQRIGFETINTYRDSLDEWQVVIWDWS